MNVFDLLSSSLSGSSKSLSDVDISSSSQKLEIDSIESSSLSISSTITSTSQSIEVAKEYYDWRDIYPELKILLDNIDILTIESETIRYHCIIIITTIIIIIITFITIISNWVPWPEDHYSDGGGTDWTVFPFLHTFPAIDQSKMSWIQSIITITTIIITIIIMIIRHITTLSKDSRVIKNYTQHKNSIIFKTRTRDEALISYRYYYYYYCYYYYYYYYSYY